MMYNFYLILIFIIILILVSLVSIEESHPMMMGVAMFIVTMMVILVMSIINKMSVYSMIFYMVMIGGILILFLYFNSFATDGVIIISYFDLLNTLYKFFTLCLIYVTMSKMDYFKSLISGNDSISEMKNFVLESNFNSFKLIYIKFDLMMIFILLYLLYLLVMVVKILFLFKPKAMRQML
uniref:NADH dehydrogenase subunit 6 n=1 Tax=Leptopilina syphax TaxID=2755057 RepID=A0A7D6J8N0_9HYME|nr:NADH dehydrogenase subunit 6 [Leptopilina syphax]